MKRLAIIAIIAALAVPAMAVPTFTDVQEVDTKLLVKLGDTAATANWVHAVPDAAVGNMTFASLRIQSDHFHPSDDDVTVKLNGFTLGKLTSSDHTFNITNQNILDSFDNSAPASATLNFTWSGWLDWWWGSDTVTIMTSTLYGEYTAQAPPIPDGPAIPAPGGLLLGSIGVGVVGWLRRRRTL